jgi:DNA-binding transcriptional MocR family regulator
MMKARYKSLVDEFANAIKSGELVAGTRLPTHRVLSAQHHISLVTATRVYAELEAMGLVSGETGRGTFVREIMLPRGQGIDRHAIASDVIDLSFNYPALPEQAELLRTALRQLSVSGDIESLLRYQPHGGKASERSVFADYLAQFGVKTAPENLMIVNGTQHGLAVAVMGLLKPGDVVAVDALTYPGFKVLAEQFHLELVAVPACGEAMDPEALRKLCKKRRVKAIYTMPTLHNPLGWVANDAFRREMAAIACEHDLLIIEDATYVWLVDNPPLPIHHYAPERTLYLAGFSKNVASGLRVGMVVAPAEKKQRIERHQGNHMEYARPDDGDCLRLGAGWHSGAAGAVEKGGCPLPAGRGARVSGAAALRKPSVFLFCLAAVTGRGARGSCGQRVT